MLANNALSEQEALHGVLIVEAQRFADNTLRPADAGTLSTLRHQAAELLAMVSALGNTGEGART